MPTVSYSATGSSTISSGSPSTTASVSITDTDKAILVLSSRNSTVSPQHGMCYGEITNGTTLTFYRDDTNNNINIEWQVVEYDADVDVTRGVTNVTTTAATGSLALSDTSKAFVVPAGHKLSGSTYNYTGGTVYDITATDTITIRVGKEDSSHYAAWQVIAFTDASDYVDVQRGNIVWETETNKTAACTAVTADQAWLTCVGATNDKSSGRADPDDAGFRAKFNSTTEIRLDRDNGADHSYVTYWEVMDSQQAIAGTQTGTIILTGASNTAPVTQVALTKSWCQLSTSESGLNAGESTYGTDDAWAHWIATVKFNSSTQLGVTRNATSGSTMTAQWFVIDWNQVDVEEEITAGSFGTFSGLDVNPGNNETIATSSFSWSGKLVNTGFIEEVATGTWPAFSGKDFKASDDIMLSTIAWPFTEQDLTEAVGIDETIGGTTFNFTNQMLVESGASTTQQIGGSSNQRRSRRSRR